MGSFIRTFGGYQMESKMCEINLKLLLDGFNCIHSCLRGVYTHVYMHTVLLLSF